MTSLVVTTDADADFDDILAYLRREAGIHLAVGYGGRFDLALQRLIKFPQSGPRRPALGKNVRIAIVPPYLLIYDYTPEDDRIILLRVLHERRNITGELVRRR